MNKSSLQPQTEFWIFFLILMVTLPHPQSLRNFCVIPETSVTIHMSLPPFTQRAPIPASFISYFAFISISQLRSYGHHLFQALESLSCIIGAPHGLPASVLNHQIQPPPKPEWSFHKNKSDPAAFLCKTLHSSNQLQDQVQAP